MSVTLLSMLEIGPKISKLDKSELILDVRSPEEFRDGHLPGSLNIPYELVAGHVDDLKKYKNIYIHCRSGRRAQIAAQTLANLGVTGLYCVGRSGMEDWVAAGLPVVKG